MTITYEEALSTLSSMFSTYTSQQLDAVLRHHGGHMEHTVETLLSHTGTPDDLIAKIKRGEVPSGGPSATTPSAIDADEELARQLAREGREQTASAGRFVPPGQRRMMASNARAPTHPVSSGGGASGALPSAASQVKKGRGTPTTLPNDFLRIPGRKYPQQSETGSAGGGMTDEQLARMLQDELFQEELRNNPEFSHLAGRRQHQMTGRSTYAGAGESAGVDWEQIGTKLADLGDAAKRRFQAFAASWSDPNQRTAQRPSSAGNERRGLLSSNNDLDMEEEMNFVGSGNGDAVELRDVGGGAGSRIDWSGDKKKD